MDPVENKAPPAQSPLEQTAAVQRMLNTPVLAMMPDGGERSYKNKVEALEAGAQHTRDLSPEEVQHFTDYMAFDAETDTINQQAAEGDKILQETIANGSDQAVIDIFHKGLDPADATALDGLTNPDPSKVFPADAQYYRDTYGTATKPQGAQEIKDAYAGLIREGVLRDDNMRALSNALLNDAQAVVYAPDGQGSPGIQSALADWIHWNGNPATLNEHKILAHLMFNHQSPEVRQLLSGLVNQKTKKTQTDQTDH